MFKIDIDPKRIYGLDILRAIAIFCVMWSHAGYFIPAAYHRYYDIPVEGVDVFFVLSGYLIGGILIKILASKQFTFPVLWDFWKRRWIRTIPNYLFILSIVLLIAYRFTPNFSIATYLPYFIFSQNLTTPHPDFFNEAWSLAVEEWFYLCTPVSIFIISLFTTKRKALLFTVSAIIVLSLCVRFVAFRASPPASVHDWDYNFRKIVFLRLDALMFGVIGAYLNFYHKELWQKQSVAKLIIGAVLVILPGIVGFPVNSLYACVLSFTVFSLGVMLCLPFLSQYKTGKGIVYRCITVLSLISYSLYLVNYTLVNRFLISDILFAKLFLRLGLGVGTSNAIAFSAFWFISITVSILLYKNLEVPVLKWRDRSKTKPTAPVPKPKAVSLP